MLQQRQAVARLGSGDAILKLFDASLLGAMRAAKDRTARFHSMANDTTVAVGAARCQSMNGTFETVECHGFSGHIDGERLVVLIAANIASCHCNSP